MTEGDIQLKQAIEDAFRWDPKVNAAKVEVHVDQGAVSLRGVVDNYAQVWAAEDAAKRVGGFHTVTQELRVKPFLDPSRTDAEIAIEAQLSLASDARVPTSVTASVQQGQINLQGRVTSEYQRNAAERDMRGLEGVVGVFNAITIVPEAG